MPRKVKHEDREPIFGLSAALRHQYQAQIEDATVDWTVDAVTYCDLVYLEKEDCPEVFRDSWPSGPEELKRVAKYFYVFSETGEGATAVEGADTLDPAATAVSAVGESPDELVQRTEAKLNQKISGVQEQLKTSLAGIESKLDKLLAG
jgi:hypothetical protein